MRLLAIGYPLPNVNIDNYNALTAPSYFDYDAMFIDPASITKVVRTLIESEDQFDAFDGRPKPPPPSSVRSTRPPASARAPPAGRRSRARSTGRSS